MTAPWCWNDAWFLEAVAWAETSSEEGAALAEVIAAADVINGAVMGRAEIEGAVHRLTGAGLVELFSRRLTLTARGNALRRPAAGHGTGQRMNWLELQLRRLPLATGDPAWTLSEDEWRTACDGYRDGFWSTYRHHAGR